MISAVLAGVVGVIFMVLGLALLVWNKKLTSHRYFRYLAIIIAIMLIAFGIYMGWRGIYLYG